MSNPGPLVDEVRRSVLAVSGKFDLQCSWHLDEPVDLCARLPVQPGLDFPLEVTVQGAAIWLSMGFMRLAWDAVDVASACEEFRAVLNGVLNGTVRFDCSIGLFARRPYLVIMEMLGAGRWERVHRYSNCSDVPWRTGRVVLRNGVAPIASGRTVDLARFIG